MMGVTLKGAVESAVISRRLRFVTRMLFKGESSTGRVVLGVSALGRAG